MNIWVIIRASAMATVSCYLFTWLVRLLAPRLGLVDHPDGQRKLQTRPIAWAVGSPFTPHFS